MPDNGSELRSINWTQALPFVRLFQTVRLALDFKRLALALAAVLLVYLGGTVLDSIWTRGGGGAVVTMLDDRRQSEVEAYATLPYDDFAAWRRLALEERSSAAARVLIVAGAAADVDGARRKLAGTSPDKIVLTPAYREQLAKVRVLVDERLREGLAAIDADKSITGEERGARRKELIGQADLLRRVLATRVARFVGDDTDLDLAIERLTTVGGTAAPADANALQKATTAQLALAAWERRQPRGPFRAVMSFQSQCFAGAVEGVMSGRWGGGNGPLDPQPSLGGSLRAFAGSLVWLVTQRPWFALFFLGYALLVLGFFGGAICRSVAVQSAREESISMGEALRFARDKYVGFLTAPLMPLAIFAGIFVVMWVGGAIGAIPRVGEIFAALAFPLTILGGFAMAMILLAVVLGFHLMWPTIAVEGSDGFDALSRACSYVGSRLWHVAFYTFALLIYGGFAFVVVRYIATLTLKCTHWAAGWGMNMGSNVALDGVGKLNGIWRMPAWSDLSIVPTAAGTPFWGIFHTAPLNWSEGLAYVLIAIFVFLVVGIVAAFVLSFFFCGSTQMYFLLRREVDATDWNEVYYEEPAPEFTPSAPPVAPAAGGATGSGGATGPGGAIGSGGATGPGGASGPGGVAATPGPADGTAPSPSQPAGATGESPPAA